MGLIPWNGSRGSVLDRIFEEPWRLIGGAERDLPAVEVFESGPDVVVRAEVAGIDPQDLDVHVEEDRVTVRGQRRDEGRREMYHSERRYGAFVRTVALPAPVDPSKARARLRHGLLEVAAPRRADDTRHGRRVEVELG
jgi:HSP20 family protein